MDRQPKAHAGAEPALPLDREQAARAFAFCRIADAGVDQRGRGW